MNEQETKAYYAFLSGLLLGWANSLQDTTQVKRVIEDMIEMSKTLADKGGILVE